MIEKDTAEIIRELRTLQRAFLDRARSLSGPKPDGVAYGCFLNAETMRMAAEELQRSVPEDAEMEGDQNNGYWRVCPECHGMIGDEDPWCRHCGKKIRVT